MKPRTSKSASRSAKPASRKPAGKPAKKSTKKTAAKKSAAKKTAPKSAKKVAKKVAKKKSSRKTSASPARPASKKVTKKAGKTAAKRVSKKSAGRKKTAKKITTKSASKSTSKAASKATKKPQPRASASKAGKPSKSMKPGAGVRKPLAKRQPQMAPAQLEAKSVMQAPSPAAPQPPAIQQAPRADGEMASAEPGPQPGDDAPLFTLRDQDGVERSLRDYAGSPVVLYFYPKDDTSGCTDQACQFRDQLPDFAHGGAVVLGVSILDSRSKAKFAGKHGLNFPLLADDATDAEGKPAPQVASRYGVWVEKSMYGRRYMGIERTTFLIDREGKVARRWSKFSVPGHAGEVLGAVRSL